MRVIMGVIKSKDGVYYVRKKVPAKLEEAVSTVIGASRQRVSWLKRSLRTKDLREANIKAKPVLMEFDRVLAKAASLLRDVPLQTHLSEREIERMAAYQFAFMLEEDEEVRREGTGSEEMFQTITAQLRNAGIEPEYNVAMGCTLSAALDGWKKAKQPAPTITYEFDHAVRRFIELHGDLRIVDIRRSHVREFREALQAIPVRRSGALRNAALPELLERAKTNSGEKKIAAATVNKLLGGVQAIALWGFHNGLTPDDVPWSDPFARMRLDEAEPQREPWEVAELQLLFCSPVFSDGARPSGGRGEAAYWLPLLALFTGARQGELAPLVVGDVTHDGATGITYIAITEDAERGTRLKTASSRRVVPVHPELVKLGFLDLVEDHRSASEKSTPLFPLLKPGPRGGYAEGWSKWFGRYIRGIGIANPARVFHSFRHTFKDALRAAGVSEDVHDALTGHSGGGVGRAYGAKEMARRFELARLAEAVSKVEYGGLDLSHLYVRKS
jgi:integrase